MRVSLMGGGTDLPSFYESHGGAVLSMSINKYFYLSIHDLFRSRGYLLKYSTVENFTSIDEIQHKIIKHVFMDYGIKSADFASAADIPAGTGLASSSSFTVSLITLCNALVGKYESKEVIAQKACEIEINKLKEPIGKQDQYACALGGMNYLEFNEDGSMNIEKIFLPNNKKEKLENNLILFYLDQTRSASKILAKQNKLSATNKEVIENLKTMKNLAKKLATDIQLDVDCVGEYLHEGWARKKKLTNDISNKQIDKFYDQGLEAGATGGKVLGAGGGGFLMFYAPNEKHQDLKDNLSSLSSHSIKMDNSGTQIVFDDRSNIII